MFVFSKSHVVIQYFMDLFGFLITSLWSAYLCSDGKVDIHRACHIKLSFKWEMSPFLEKMMALKSKSHGDINERMNTEHFCHFCRCWRHRS